MILIVYAIMIIGEIAGILLVIALASNKAKQNDVEAFYEAKRKCKLDAYDEILKRCKEKSFGGEVNYLSIEDLEGIINNLK